MRGACFQRDPGRAGLKKNAKPYPSTFPGKSAPEAEPTLDLGPKTTQETQNPVCEALTPFVKQKASDRGPGANLGPSPVSLVHSHARSFTCGLGLLCVLAGGDCCKEIGNASSLALCRKFVTSAVESFMGPRSGGPDG